MTVSFKETSAEGEVGIAVVIATAQILVPPPRMQIDEWEAIKLVLPSMLI